MHTIERFIAATLSATIALTVVTGVAHLFQAHGKNDTAMTASQTSGAPAQVAQMARVETR